LVYCGGETRPELDVSKEDEKEEKKAKGEQTYAREL
jgi:hypothetical protein